MKAVLHSSLQEMTDQLGLGLDPLEIDPACGLSAVHAAALHGDDTLMTMLLGQKTVRELELRKLSTRHVD